MFYHIFPYNILYYNFLRNKTQIFDEISYNV